MNKTEEYPKINGFYKHYKGGTYQVLFLSTHTENVEILVNYKSIEFGTYYSRPLKSFNGIVEDTTIKRFEYIKQD